jgi:hypothetical protein
MAQPTLVALGRWSRKHDACVARGSAGNRHYARGLCFPCYRNGENARRRSVGFVPWLTPSTRDALTRNGYEPCALDADGR